MTGFVRVAPHRRTGFGSLINRARAGRDRGFGHLARCSVARSSAWVRQRRASGQALPPVADPGAPPRGLSTRAAPPPGGPGQSTSSIARLSPRIAPPGVWTTCQKDACLIVSELVSNSVRHAGRVIQLTVSGFRLASRGNRPVHPPDPTPEPTNLAYGGRGLLLVDSLAGHYGVEMRLDAKTIWAEFRLLTRTQASSPG